MLRSMQGLEVLGDIVVHEDVETAGTPTCNNLTASGTMACNNLTVNGTVSGNVYSKTQANTELAKTENTPVATSPLQFGFGAGGTTTLRLDPAAWIQSQPYVGVRLVCMVHVDLRVVYGCG